MVNTRNAFNYFAPRFSAPLAEQAGLPWGFTLPSCGNHRAKQVILTNERPAFLCFIRPMMLPDSHQLGHRTRALECSIGLSICRQ
jgi:hypothetical protein